MVRRVCVRVCSATVVNYEYLFYWYLYQDGTIQVSTLITCLSCSRLYSLVVSRLSILSLPGACIV